MAPLCKARSWPDLSQSNDAPRYGIEQPASTGRARPPYRRRDLREHRDNDGVSGLAGRRAPARLRNGRFYDSVNASETLAARLDYLAHATTMLGRDQGTRMETVSTITCPACGLATTE